ncbi:glycerophosphodiester phosphodiesterase [Wenzhouxiangella sp. XN24]|uniref:glycerophosphodiester phosphodiesterase n=1 Tax=Wenzhouxiangella sp. XN24 TaxID=2713569 RepID=UPI0013EB420D|nr:glycerophosphodiester phosphodiesterase [Wenzhouxiangella sp. XN24]NGX17567.1 glycerophosphodiester phosphodiesterase [Wenzhouxiangella sp. XN24]
MSIPRVFRLSVLLVSAAVIVPSATRADTPPAGRTGEPQPGADTAEAVHPVVIAHRGASGYLPEHTLAAYAFAYALGADFIEPDIVLTSDGHPVALHDLTLDATTDVRERFPGRARADGLHYALDFTLAELRQLRVFERIEPGTGEPRYPARFPAGTGNFGIVTLAELIELVQGLNTSTGRNVGIYPETKFPAFHAEHGHDLAAIVAAELERHGYSERNDYAIIQSFEPEPLRRLREKGVRLRLVQLLGENDWDMNDVDYTPMYTPEGLAEIAKFADGIGPPISRILLGAQADGTQKFSTLVTDARQVGLSVHPYTVRTDNLPHRLSVEELLHLLLEVQCVDGLFIDQPDAMVRFLRARKGPGFDSRRAAGLQLSRSGISEREPGQTTQRMQMGHPGETRVRCRSEPHGSYSRRGERNPAIDQQPGQRKHLERVNANEMRDPQVAGD